MIETVTLTFSVLAFIIAAKVAKHGGATKQELDDARRDARRDAENLADEVRRELSITRRLLADLASGGRLERDQILEGRLWRDADPREGLGMVEEGGDLHVLDVRTPGEQAAGVIPGAQCIPIDQLPSRLGEVPKGKARTLVVCAGGGRSAAACELLAGEGFEGLFNLAGGMGSWSGPTEKPQSSD